MVINNLYILYRILKAELQFRYIYVPGFERVSICIFGQFTLSVSYMSAFRQSDGLSENRCLSVDQKGDCFHLDTSRWTVLSTLNPTSIDLPYLGLNAVKIM